MRKLMLNKKLATAVTVLSVGFGSAGLFVGPSHAAAQQGQNDRDSIAISPLSERWFTKPSEEVALDFSAPGLIVEVTVKEGDAVKKGQLLAKQDVSVEAANKAMYEIEANSAVEEEYARKDLELKKVKFQKT
jgi:multidrug efflux pump subunit AcrA (membrane-fusion protein)